MTAKIVRMTPFTNGKSKTKAFFTVAVGDFEIADMKLIEGKNGYFVGFPSRSYEAKDGTTKYTETVKTSKAITQTILEAAVAEYERREADGAPTPKAAVPTPASVTLDDNEEDDLPF